MKKFLVGVFTSTILFACNSDKTETKAEEKTEAASTTEKKPPATEVLDLSEGDDVKASFAALSKGDIEGMTASYADDARAIWSSGDSVVGKAAIMDYWKGRWKLIDSLNFSDIILLPIKINESQNPKYALTGKWVMAWTFSHVKYKNGKSLHFWVHTDYHYNDAGKVERSIQYIDRQPIMEATKDLMKK